MFLLGAVTLCCTLVAGTFTLLEPVVWQPAEKQVAYSRAVDASAPEPVRVVGARFVPNVNPRER
ncbi:hypothetical protein [Bradyrhizobium sp. 930_D9_N1_4]|uniref:hypothetical protein n=1 Tax=Bradyrhizobium sp. 930_D9_N1_4 TaxID=3240374 RepID=UPI003F894644